MKDTTYKIYTLETLLYQREEWKAEGKKVVFTNGCFDLLHPGHIEYLEASRAKGDVLIIGVNTDESVQRLKGALRPIVPEWARLRVLAALQYVDAVVLFNDDTPLTLIEKLSPDVLTKGADYTIDTIVGAKFVLDKGGSVETIQLVEGFSTTNIVKRIETGYRS